MFGKPDGMGKPPAAPPAGGSKPLPSFLQNIGKKPASRKGGKAPMGRGSSRC